MNDAVVQEDAGKRFQAVNTAYQVLSDPGARAQYDRLLPTDSGMSNFFRDVDPDVSRPRTHRLQVAAPHLAHTDTHHLR